MTTSAALNLVYGTDIPTPAAGRIAIGSKYGTDLTIKTAAGVESTLLNGTAVDTIDHLNVGSATGAAAGTIKATGPVSGYLQFGQGNANPYGLSATTSYIVFAGIPRSTTITQWLQTFMILTTNNASNYWTITLESNSKGTIASLSTASATASTWTLASNTSLNTAISTAADGVLFLAATKTNSPGNLYLMTPYVYVL